MVDNSSLEIEFGLLQYLFLDVIYNLKSFKKRIIHVDIFISCQSAGKIYFFRRVSSLAKFSYIRIMPLSEVGTG